MPAQAEDMVLVPRAELDALRAENRRLRREAGDREALKRIRSDTVKGCVFTRELRRGAVASDRVLPRRQALVSRINDIRILTP